MSRRTEESKRVKAILDYLQYRRVFAWRQNNIAVPSVDGFRSFVGMRGLPDIIGVLPGGVFLGIEVKSKTGRQSKHQKEFQKNLERLGGVYILARCVDDVEKGLSKYFGGEK